MSNSLLTIAARCRDTEQCLFDGKDLFLDIEIGNRDKSPIGFPLTYLQKCGPVIRLIDKQTKAETYLRRNLADLALKEQFTEISPGRSVTLVWVISPSELSQFAHEKKIDVSAEITIQAGARIGGRVVDVQGTDILRIAGEIQH